MRDFPLGATACGPGRRVPACGPPGSGPGQAGHSSWVPGGPWLTLHALTGSSRQTLLGRRDYGAGRRRVRFGPEPNWKRGQWGPGLARGTEGNRPRRRPGPGSGPVGRRASPKEKTWGPREGAPTARGRAARAQGRRCRRPSGPFRRCARHTDTASRSWSFHPDIGPEPTAFILVRGKLLNRTKDGRGREVGEGATEGGHVPAVPAGAWTGTARCHRETRRPGRLPPAAVGTLVCLLLRTPPSGVFAVGPHRKT